jgi:hypothetical protein
MTLKSDQNPDPHWFGSLDPDPQRDKKNVSGHGHGSALKQMRIRKTSEVLYSTELNLLCEGRCFTDCPKILKGTESRKTS